MTMLSREEIRARVHRTPKVVKEFRAFILRGSVADLAVIILAFVVFLFVVKPLNRLLAVIRSRPECLSSMPLAKRCASCGIAAPPLGASPVEGAHP